jgi:hypothetical protein
MSLQALVITGSSGFHLGDITVGMGLALTSRQERGPTEGFSSRNAETDQGTTVARPWLREFRKAFRSGSPGRVAPGRTEALAPCRHSLSLPTQDSEETHCILVDLGRMAHQRERMVLKEASLQIWICPSTDTLVQAGDLSLSWRPRDPRTLFLERDP